MPSLKTRARRVNQEASGAKIVGRAAKAGVRAAMAMGGAVGVVRAVTVMALAVRAARVVARAVMAAGMAAAMMTAPRPILRQPF